MSYNEKPYWFAAKTFGWGWTLPVTWQGWLTILTYVALVIGFLSVVPDPWRLPLVALGTAVLVAIVVWKGEKPVRWRWGRG